MAREVIWAYAAEDDLVSAAEYIHKDSPVYAASFVDRALDVGVLWIASQSVVTLYRNLMMII